MFANPFSKKPVVEQIARSTYFPDKFYANKMLSLDDSVAYFARKSMIKLPYIPLFVKGFKHWKIGEDWFEEVLLDVGDYKLIYDNTNGIFYFLQKMFTQPDQQNMTVPYLSYNDRSFMAFSGALTLDGKNEMLAIFNREISHEADEYLFIELSSPQNGSFTETWFCGIIVQENLIK